MGEWLTLAQVRRKHGIAYATIRRYIGRGLIRVTEEYPMRVHVGEVLDVYAKSDERHRQKRTPVYGQRLAPKTKAEKLAMLTPERRTALMDVLVQLMETGEWPSQYPVSHRGRLADAKEVG